MTDEVNSVASFMAGSESGVDYAQPVPEPSCALLHSAALAALVLLGIPTNRAA